MGFWIFMLIMDLLLPFTMIGFGRYFMKKAPKEINSVFGYRTSMSMKNKDTWEFAHKYCGKVWYVCGMVMLPITVIFMLLVIGKNEDCVGSIGGIICGVQLIPLIGSILPTEIALKRILIRMEQDDKFRFANLPFERGEILFSKGFFLFIRIFANYKIKPKLHIL